MASFRLSPMVYFFQVANGSLTTSLREGSICVIVNLPHSLRSEESTTSSTQSNTLRVYVKIIFEMVLTKIICTEPVKVFEKSIPLRVAIVHLGDHNIDIFRIPLRILQTHLLLLVFYQ